MKCVNDGKVRTMLYGVVLVSLLLTLNMLTYPAGIDLLKVDNRNITKSEICSKLTIKTPERRQWHCSGVFVVNFEHISQLVLYSFYC